MPVVCKIIEVSNKEGKGKKVKTTVNVSLDPSEVNAAITLLTIKNKMVGVRLGPANVVDPVTPNL